MASNWMNQIQERLDNIAEEVQNELDLKNFKIKCDGGFLNDSNFKGMDDSAKEDCCNQIYQNTQRLLKDYDGLTSLANGDNPVREKHIKSRVKSCTFKFDTSNSVNDGNDSYTWYKIELDNNGVLLITVNFDHCNDGCYNPKEKFDKAFGWNVEIWTADAQSKIPQIEETLEGMIEKKISISVDWNFTTTSGFKDKSAYDQENVCSVITRDYLPKLATESDSLGRQSENDELFKKSCSR